MWTDDPEAAFSETEPGPSKSSLKRESAALQDLGQALLELSAEQLERLDLPPELLEAVRLGQVITARGGLRRQRKFIGKLLRQFDAESIRAALAGLTRKNAETVRLQHLCERWRDRMLEEGELAVNAFVAGHPGSDRRKLRQLVLDGRRERSAAQAPHATRRLFRYLREALSSEVPDED